MKFNNIHKKINLAFIALVAIIFTVAVIGTADGVIPGSEQDPLVTQSFVNQRVAELQLVVDNAASEINKHSNELIKQRQEIAKQNAIIEAQNTEITSLKTEISSLKEQIASLGGAPVRSAASQNRYVPVKLPKGKALLTGESTEILVKVGRCTAIASKSGGIMDIITGKDLRAGEAVTINRVLLSLQNDGRGVRATVDATIWVKGSYTIK